MQPGDDRQGRQASRAGIARRADELLDAALYPASVASPKTGEEVSLSPAMTAVSYELAGHPVRESYTFTPSRDQGSWKLLALATGLEPLEPRGRGC